MAHCEDRDRLLSDYAAAVLKAVRFMGRLPEAASAGSKTAYAALLKEIALAKRHSIAAREVYEQHLLEHQCG